MTTATNADRGLGATPPEPRAWPTLEQVEEGTRRVRRAIVDARHTAEDAASDARLIVRRHPLTAMSVGTVAGAVLGALCGFAFAWFARTRQS